uniref:Secreted protein n=1 Tax=Ascaris lumbricoides TaxID=6252 RepID=A0A0M3IVD9_ASCLU
MHLLFAYTRIASERLLKATQLINQQLIQMRCSQGLYKRVVAISSSVPRDHRWISSKRHPGAQKMRQQERPTKRKDFRNRSSKTRASSLKSTNLCRCLTYAASCGDGKSCRFIVLYNFEQKTVVEDWGRGDECGIVTFFIFRPCLIGERPSVFDRFS